MKRNEITENDIIDVLVTALEGGSNYWYFLPDLSMVKEIGTNGKAISENVAISALNGATIPVHDTENEECFLGSINKENIERGITLFIQNDYEFEPDMDASDADTLFQYIVLGEIVFG